MAKTRYSAGLKVIAVAALLVFSVILTLSVMMLVVLFQKDILDFGDLRNKSFESSSYFSSRFQEAAEEILNFIELRKKFETDGSYDDEKEMAIWEYYSNQGFASQPGKSKDGNRLQYYLGDLSEWSRKYRKASYEFASEYTIDQGIHLKQDIYKDGTSILSEEKTISSLEEMTAELQEMVVQNVEHYYGGSYSMSGGLEGRKYSEATVLAEENALEDSLAKNQAQNNPEATAEDSEEEAASKRKEQLEKIIQKVRSGKLYDLNGEELVLLLETMDMNNMNTIANYEFIEEDYLPVRGDGIWENFMEGNYSMSRMCNAYAALEYTLSNIGEDLNQYKRCLNRYNLSENGTNIFYWISRGNEDTIYTNIREPLNMGFAEYGKEKGKYVYYRESDIRLETNVKGMEDVFYGTLEPKYGGKGALIFICVDTSFPNEDEVKMAKEEYMGMRPWIYSSLAGAVISFVICLICLIYLSMAAGRRDGEEKVYLNLFDRIPTEILYFLLVTAGITCFLVFGRLFYQFSSEALTGLLVASGAVAFFSVALLTIFYLSFVRRIRAGILWKGSILYWFLHGISLLFTKKTSSKMLMWFGLHFLACCAILALLLDNVYEEGIAFVGTAAFVLLSGAEAVMLIREGVQRGKVLQGIRKISGGDLEYKVAVDELKGDNKCLAEAVNAIGDGLFHAVDDSVRNEHLKTDLITNVSHDIKTPLTSIINYVDLLKREDLQDERVQGYIAVLDSKSQRLKQLTEDLVEASKVSSGNIKLEMERIDLVELVHQSEGEFGERFEARNLTVISKLPREPVIILADGRRIWRVLENLYSNVAKYAMEHTRVYVDMEADGKQVSFSVKNISENPLNIQAEELTERFIRGDISRSTEGSGLGLSIAKSLTELMDGTFEIYLDGDLFKATVSFPQEPENLNLTKVI